MLLDFPLTVALAVVATVGYLLGRVRRKAKDDTAKPSKYELTRAQSVVSNLESVSRQVRSSLAEHHAALTAFKAKVGALNSTDPNVCHDLAIEAERVLKPTQELSTQISLAYEEIRQQASMLLSFTELRTDPLTRLRNRRALDETLASNVALFSRYGSIVSVVMIDIDRFKQLNDRCGHVRGDEVLQAVASALTECARESDIVARYGGEEFTVVCPSTDLEGASIFAERMRQYVERTLDVTVSAGVATVLAGDTVRSLITRADSALYGAKAGGRNRVYQHTGCHMLPFFDQVDSLDDSPNDSTGEPSENRESSVVASSREAEPAVAVT